MRATPAEAPLDLSYSGPPPVLIAGDTAAARDRAAATVAASGLRIGAVLGLHDASDRIRSQASASALWIELDEDGGAAMDALLDHVADEVSDGRCAAVVAARASLLDPVMARLANSSVEFVIDGNMVERLSALSLVTSGAFKPARIHDARDDQDQARLRQLSDEVSRIATTLARLSAGPGTTPPKRSEAPPAAEIPEVPIDTVRTVIRARRLRSRYFEEELFADPAWDMLLDLLQAEIAQLRVPVSSLCIAAAVPATTALRWLKTMTDKGLFVRRADPHDGRRVFVELAPHASAAMRRYFAEVGKPATV